MDGGQGAEPRGDHGGVFANVDDDPEKEGGGGDAEEDADEDACWRVGECECVSV